MRKRAHSPSELIQKNVGYFFKDIERSARIKQLTVFIKKYRGDSTRRDSEMEMMPFLDSVGLVLDDNKYYLFSRRANDKIVVYHQNK